MNNQGGPIYVQPTASRPFMYDTTLGGLRISGVFILVLLVISSIVTFVGVCMAIFGFDDYKESCRYITNTSCYYYWQTSGVRKAGIVFTVFGGIALIFSVIMAFKGKNENKISRGMIILPQGQAHGMPQAPYQMQQPGPSASGTVLPAPVPVPVGPGYDYMNKDVNNSPPPPYSNAQ